MPEPADKSPNRCGGGIEHWTTCVKCHGLGVRSVYFGKYGGTVECDLCDGEGKVALSATDTDRIEASDE